jgi:hypothetical protein
MAQESTESYRKGYRQGDRYQRHSNARPWSTGAGLGSNPPRKQSDTEYNRGVSDGRTGVRKT